MNRKVQRSEIKKVTILFIILVGLVNTRPCIHDVQPTMKEN